METYTDEIGHYGDIHLNQLAVVTLPSGAKAYGRVLRITAGDQGGALFVVRSERTGKVNHYIEAKVSSLLGDILGAR